MAALGAERPTQEAAASSVCPDVSQVRMPCKQARERSANMARKRGAEGRPPGGRKKGRNREFMDAALDGFIRDQALLLWRDIETYRARGSAESADALKEAGYFGDKGQYEEIWTRHWVGHVLSAADLPEGNLFGCVEAAVRASVTEEREARRTQGDALLEDTDEYNAFIRQTMGKLLAGGFGEKGI